MTAALLSEQLRRDLEAKGEKTAPSPAQPPRTGAVQAHFSCITNWTCFILLLRKTESCLKALTSMILSLALGSELVNSDRLTDPDTPPLIPV